MPDARSSCRVLLQDAALELAEVRAGLEAELVQPSPDGRVEIERLGLAPRSVERVHRQRLRAFPERLLARQRQRFRQDIAPEPEL